ncbi:MAG: energy-coupling factor transporter ATPase [Oscillospiraceae bacterium]|nr:energy-coupling factor transporter ATPase [Oscillospiraceae bacterium]
MIKLENVNFSYRQTADSKNILQDINLTIQAGEFISIVGANGSGKSTLAKHLNGLLIPLSGDVWVFDKNTKQSEHSLFVKQHVGMVFQNPDNQAVTSIVEEDVAFALENLGIPQQEMVTRVEAALGQLGMLEHKTALFEELSGGQKQRVAIAGVLAMQPQVIVLDEPTAMLDPQGRKDVLKILGELHSQFGITVVLITHFMEEAALTNRIVVMHAGKIALDKPPHQVFAQPELLKSFGLLLPQATRLCQKLRPQTTGNDLPPVLSNADCVREIAKILGTP